MKTRFFRVSAAFVAFALFTIVAVAQRGVSTADKFLISAKAGAVNAVIGDVSVERLGRTSRLFKNDAVQETEKVLTGADGKVEILMNPGSYVRLGGDSSFEFGSTDLNDVRVKLHRGSAVFEVLGMDNFTVDVTAGRSRFALVDSGIYRIDIEADGDATVSIWKGKLLPSVNAKKTISSGQKINYNDRAIEVAKFDRKAQDELMQWSSSRAKELSAVSASLKPSILRDTLVSSFFSNRWNTFDSFGLWVFNPYFGSYCFLPFGYGWQSPYGFGYGRSLWYYNMPVIIYNTPPVRKVAGRPNTRSGPQDDGFAGWKRSNTKDSRSGGIGSSNPGGDPQRPGIDTRSDRPTKIEAPPVFEPVFVQPPSSTRSPNKKP